LGGRAITVDIDEDGKYSAIGVPPGIYRLDAMFFEPPKPSRIPDFARYIGGGPKSFSVPAIAGSQSQSAIDLGDVETRLIVRLEPGDQAPDFEVKILDGRTLRLSDLRGKFVVLDFWATWCGPCVRELPELKKSVEALKDEPRVVVIGMSLDNAPEKVGAFVQEHDYRWQHAVIGPGSTIAKSFGVTAIPHIVLVNPDGRIGSGVGAYHLDQTLRRVLEKWPMTQPTTAPAQP
jgi:peroxiredoxin